VSFSARNFRLSQAIAPGMETIAENLAKTPSNRETGRSLCLKFRSEVPDFVQF
jgi:hypothetical protein